MPKETPSLGSSHHDETVRLWKSLAQDVSADAPSTNERRRHRRYLLPNTPCRILFPQAPPPGDIVATICNVTDDGVGLCVPARLPTNTPVRIAPCQTDTPPIPAHVVYCVPSAGSYRIGMQFDDARATESHD